MRFDDRLTTVLARPAAGPYDRAVRWRQLVELVARAGAEADPDLTEEAIEQIRADGALLDDKVRLATAVAVSPLPLPVALVAAFAADRIAVAAPVLASAELNEAEWRQVTAAASAECRDFIASMRSRTEPAGPLATDEDQPSEAAVAVPTISDVVARIERRRSSREANSAEPEGTAEGEDIPRVFRWECNEFGDIDWVEGAPRGAVVGHSIARAGLTAGVDRSVERAFAARAKFRDALLELTHGAVTGGSWKISGVPAFEPASGRFAGYRGVAERHASRAPSAGLPADPDMLRELAHEIRTPLNAIIGFAEIITGEYLGPAERRFRERAGDIVAQARQLLAAVEDIDLAAQLHTPEEEGTADLSEILSCVRDGIDSQAKSRGVAVAFAGTGEPARCALNPKIAQRLVERFCGALVACAHEGEMLDFRLSCDPAKCALNVNRPASLENARIDSERSRRSGDSATLPLRLVMGLARAAGGDLDTDGELLVLRIPRA